MDNIAIMECPYVSEDTMECLRQRLGLDEMDTSRDEEILGMSGWRFLDEYLSWQGIYGYTGEILDVIYEAFGIDLTEYPFDGKINRAIEE